MKTLIVVFVFLFLIWIFSTCGCTHGGAYGLYEGLANIGKDGATVSTGIPSVAIDKKSKTKTKEGVENASAKGKAKSSEKKSDSKESDAPEPVTTPTTDKKGNASVSATASPANPKEGYTNLMGYNSNNSTVNWGYPAPVSNYVPPAESNPLSYGELNMFAETSFKPECCPSTYSNSMGCACINKDQYNYLITRGGNNVPFAII